MLEQVRREMAIPLFDARGFLPPGIHVAESWEEVAGALAFNAHREVLLSNMRTFVRDELAPLANGLDMVIGGSFLSNKEVPGDIDCTVLFPLATIDQYKPALELLANDGAKNRIWLQYKVEAYPTLQFPNCSDFTAFFQYVGVKSAATTNCSPTDLRGVLKVTSWTAG